MLTTPDSELVRHRLAWHAPGTEPAELARLAQLRAQTAALCRDRDGAGAAQPATAGCVRCAGCGFLTTVGGFDAEGVARLRPAAATAVDQCHLDAASLHRRLAAILAQRPVSSSRVAFVGDDDLASVALLRAQPPRRLLLVDIDERILAVAAAEAARLGLSGILAAERVNLSDAGDLAGLLGREGESYDLVVTDPPYAEGGMATFTATAMHLTTYGGEVHLAVPAMLAEAWTDELLMAVQADLTGSGFLIERVVPGAFTYPAVGVVSSLVIARRLAGSRLAPGPLVRAPGRFYTTRTDPGRLDPAVFAPHPPAQEE